MDIKELEKIAKLLSDNDITEFKFKKDDGTVIEIKRNQGEVALSSASQGIVLHNIKEGQLANNIATQPQHSISAQEGNQDTEGALEEENFIKVESPIVGTFYRRPAPDADPFVKEGDLVKKGDTLCIVEAMKLMNEIESPIDGKVEKILASDAQVVEFGEVLFLINPNV